MKICKSKFLKEDKLHRNSDWVVNPFRKLSSPTSHHLCIGMLNATIRAPTVMKSGTYKTACKKTYQKRVLDFIDTGCSGTSIIL